MTAHMIMERMAMTPDAKKNERRIGVRVFTVTHMMMTQLSNAQGIQSMRKVLLSRRRTMEIIHPKRQQSAPNTEAITARRSISQIRSTHLRRRTVRYDKKSVSKNPTTCPKAGKSLR